MSGLQRTDPHVGRHGRQRFGAPILPPDPSFGPPRVGKGPNPDNSCIQPPSDLPHPERVVQVCHPDLRNEFPPLQTLNTCAKEPFSSELTSFVGRDAEIREVGRILAHNRLVTLTGTGGAGKTRLAAQVAAQLAGEFCDGMSWVDLAPVTDPHLVPVTVARALGAPEQPGRSILDTL